MKKTIKRLVGGFTLIELMVVVAIIAILTAIVISNLSTPKAKSRDAQRISDLAQIQLALELFFDRCNAYPRYLNTAETLPSPNNCPINATTGRAVTLGDFITTIPTDPSNHASYYYAFDSGTGSTLPTDSNPPINYTLRAPLETYNSLSNNVTGYYPNFCSAATGNCGYNYNGSTYSSVTNQPTGCNMNPNNPYNYCVGPK